MAIALLTTYLAGYRIPLYQRLAERHDLEVLCFGGGERYVPAWFADLDAQLAQAPFAARRVSGAAQAARLAGGYDAVIAPFAGGAVLPAAYAGARARRRAFVLWASVWAEPHSAAHLLARPASRRIYRHADAVVAYGEHVRRFVRNLRGRDDDVFVAPQSVEPELFARQVPMPEVEAFRARHRLPPGPLALYVGRLVPEKGVDVLLSAWRQVRGPGTLVLIGDGPLAEAARAADPPPEAAAARARARAVAPAGATEDPAGAGNPVRLLGPLPRAELPAAYATADLGLLPSVPTPRFREPWGLVCNEAMHQGRPVIATTAVGAVAGGLVRDEENGLVVAPGDAAALAAALDRLLTDEGLRQRLGAGARRSVAGYTYDVMADAFDQALGLALSRHR